jgi:hypothetical protein
MFANRNRCRTPYIRKHLFKGNNGYTGRHTIWQLMTLGKLTRVRYIRIYFWRMRNFIFLMICCTTKEEGCPRRRCHVEDDNFIVLKTCLEDPVEKGTSG